MSRLELSLAILACSFLLISVLSECEGVRVSLSRNGERREKLLSFARENLGLSEQQKLPLEHRMNTIYRAEANYSKSSRTVTTTLPLYGGASVGVVYMDFTLGTPAHTYTAQVDTGSSDLGLPLNSCTTCDHVPQVYNPTTSSTAAAVPCTTSVFSCPTCHSKKCGYQISYADGSGFSADLYTDTMHVGGLSLSGQSVGGIYKEHSSGSFEPADVDGIIGMAYRSLSETNSPTFMDSLVSSGQTANIFSMCMDEDGGAMELGGIIASFNTSASYVPLRLPLYFYAVTMTDLKVGNTSVGLSSNYYNSDGTIFDSGTTDLLLPTAAYNKVHSILSASCSTKSLVGVCNVRSGQSLFDGYCYQMTAAQVAMYPSLQLVLQGGVTLEIPPHYWIVDNYCSRAGYYALAIDPISENGVILGDVVHRVYTVIYDRANTRIGVAPTTVCPQV